MNKKTDFVFSSDRIKWKTPEDEIAFHASGTDWADEIVDDSDWEVRSVAATEIAVQLRKAKAAGMREAAAIAENADLRGLEDNFAGELRVVADKIEKGE